MFWRVDQFVTFRESARSPTFHNPLYCTELHQAVLRPFSHMSDLVLWWVEYKLQLTRFYHVLCTVFMFFLHFQGLLCQRGAPVWPPLWPWGLWSWRSSGKRTWGWWGHEQQHQTGFLIYETDVGSYLTSFDRFRTSRVSPLAMTTWLWNTWTAPSISWSRWSSPGCMRHLVELQKKLRKATL